MSALLAATDVHYLPSGGARAAVVMVRDPRFERIVTERVVDLDDVAEYEPGRFYLRELPALKAVLDGVIGLSLLIVDGYVDLEPNGRRPGLGFHCHEAFGVPVIGVAKTSFQGATHAAEVRREASHRPLYVTAAGLSVAEAADLVANMSGPFRLPDALKRLDALARGLATRSPPAWTPSLGASPSRSPPAKTPCSPQLSPPDLGLDLTLEKRPGHPLPQPRPQ